MIVWESLKAPAVYAVLGLSLVLLPVGTMIAATTASADDIPVVASVINPSPSATFDSVVKLPIGESSQSAPFTLLTLSGLEPYSFVQIFAQSEPILIASGFADKDGEFRVKVRLPPTLEAGSHSIVAFVQKEGELVAKSVTIAKFSVSASGTIGKSNASNSGDAGTGGGSASAGGGGASGNGSGGTPTSSAEPTPKPTNQEADLSRGAIFVSGLSADSSVNLNPLDQTVRIVLTLRNNRNIEIPVSVRVSVSNFLGLSVSGQSSPEKIIMLPNQTRSVMIKPIVIGHWGFYTAHVDTDPQGSVNGTALQPLMRELSFFSLPVLPVMITTAYITIEFVRRLIAPSWRSRKFSLAFVTAKDDDGEAK
jgi:hypothetical protein